MNKSRALLLFIVFNLLIFKSLAQKFTYHVLTVRGTVTSKNMGRQFQTGDFISTDDEVMFKGDEDMVGLIRSDGKRFILKNKEQKKGINVKFEEAKMIGKTRVEWKNLTLNSLEDLHEYFCESPFIFLDSTAKIRINRKNFTQNGAQYFYFHFNWKGPNGVEPVDKKLDFKSDTLILRQKTIFNVDKKSIQQKDVSDYNLWYYNKGDLVRVGEFNVIFPDQELMKNEIKIMVDILKKNNVSPKIIHGDIEAYIRQFYGAIDKINLVNWLDRNFSVPTM